MMRKPQFPKLGLAFFAISIFSSNLLLAETFSRFLLLSPSVDIVQKRDQLEAMGIHVRHIVPPSILIADFPSSTPQNLEGVKASYAGVVPASQLEPMGPLAVAAGMEWNKKIARTMGTMSAAANEVLPAPKVKRAEINGRTLTLEWDGIRGGLAYEIELASDQIFSQILTRNHTDRTVVTLPVTGTFNDSLFVHVRAIDRPDQTNENADLRGSWSDASQLKVLTPPLPQTDPEVTPSSPADGIETTGFSVVLEWMGTSRPYRIQVSKSKDFGDVLVDEVVTGGEYSLTSSALHVGDNLFWRLQSWGPSTGPWSSARSIKVGAPRSSMIDGFVNPEGPR